MSLDGIGRWVTVEVALGDTPFAASPTWVDIADHVEGATADAGSASLFNRYKASTLDVQLNNTDLFLDPADWNRWKQVRLLYLDGPTPLAHAHIDDSAQEWGSQAPIKLTASLDCVDGVGLFARRDLDDEPVPGGTVQEVITYLAGLAGLPTPTFVGMSTIPIARMPAASGNVLEIIQDILDTESGYIVHQAQDGLLALEVRGRYAALVAWQNYLDNGPPCIFRGDPTAGAEPPELAIRRGSMPMVPVSETYRDEVTAKGTVGDAYTQSVAPAAETPQSTFSRTEMVTASRNWIVSSVDMWLKIFTQTAAVPRQIDVLCATPAAELDPFRDIRSLRFGDIVEVVPRSGADPIPVELVGRKWTLTRQSLVATLSFAFPHMATYYGGIDAYAAVGAGVVGTSKVAP